MRYEKTKFDYSMLLGFIYSNKKIKNKSGLAKFLGITIPCVCSKLNNKTLFTQNEIMAIKKQFGLTPDEIDRFFFTEEI